jgi:hypothetical protein
MGPLDDKTRDGDTLGSPGTFKTCFCGGLPFNEQGDIRWLEAEVVHQPGSLLRW